MYAVFPRKRLRINLLALPAFALVVWLEGLLPASLLFAAALLHEAGHLLCILIEGVPIRRIDIEPMGGLIVYDDSLCSLGATVRITFAGALANLLAAGVTLLLAPKHMPALFFSLANLFLALLNLLPWKKLDGGKLLLCLLLFRNEPSRAERVCAVASDVSLLLLSVGMLLLGFQTDFPLWSLLLSACLLAQAI